MSFNGPALSFDDEGSILFDGEKIIVTVPVGHEVLNHLGAEEDIPFPVVYTHPSHAQNQQPSSSVAEPAGSGGSAGTTSTRKPPVYFDDVAAYGQRAEQRAAAQLEALADISKDGQFQSDTSSQPVEPTWHDTTPLTHLQEEYVDHLLAVETDTLAREVLLGLKREGLPSEAYVRDFMIQFAEWGWDDLSSALAWQVLANVRNSHWDETFAYADADYVEAVAQDQANDWIEGLVIIDAGSGKVVLRKTGVWGPGGQQYVGLQDYEVEALQGLNLIFVHNHPNDTGASDDDLKSAFDAGAELLIVITPSGREQVFIRGRDRMVEVRDEKASYEIGPGTLDEALWLQAESQAQARKYLVDAPEYVFLQNDPSQPENAIYAPIGLTDEQATEMFWNVFNESASQLYFADDSSAWKSAWQGDPRKWPEYLTLSLLLYLTIPDVAHRWNHPALGMSDDEVAVLLLAHLRQEGHYRNVGGVFDGIKNWISRTFLGGDPSVGPVNLRPSVVDEILGTSDEPPHIPMLIGPDLHFDDMGLLDSLQSEWQNATSDSAREALLMDDEFSIELAGANIYRGAERLFRTYLFHELGLKTEADIQGYLEARGLQREDLIERYLQQEEYRASMFTMLAWSSQGIPESDRLRSDTGDAAEIARWHASGGVQSINAILFTGAFGLNINLKEVRMFNDDDIYSYRLN